MSCNCGYTLPTGGGDKKSGKNLCICFRDFVSLCSEGIEPCGGSYTLDLAPRITNDISDSQTVSIYSKPHAFETAEIISGELVVTTSDTAIVGRSYYVVLEITTEKDGTTYGTFGIIKLCVKDLCKNVLCSDGQECDECDGGCIDTVVDLES